jgi:hypothetical protein
VVQMLVEAQTRRSMRDQARQRRLAHGERIAAEVVASWRYRRRRRRQPRRRRCRSVQHDSGNAIPKRALQRPATRQIRLAWDGAETGMAQGSARLWARVCIIESGVSASAR